MEPRETGITQAFELAHGRLAAALRACAEVSLEPAAAAAAVLRVLADVRRHLRFEEDTLYTRFEDRSGLREQGPTVLLRREHREIESRLEGLAAAFEIGEVSDARAGIRALSALLEDHCRREAAALFPACDRLLEDAERQRALRVLSREGSAATGGARSKPGSRSDARRPGKRGHE